MSSPNPQLEDDPCHPLPAPVVIKLETKNSTHGDNTYSDAETVTESSSSKAYSILASSIQAPDYQKLLDRGWRRSGDLLYLPKNWECCCPSHPIRLDVNRFVPTKGHKKVLRNFRTALNGASVDVKEQKDELQKSLSGKGSHAVQGRKRPRKNAHASDQKQNCNENNGEFTFKPDLGNIHKHARDLVAKCNILSNLKNETLKSVRDYGRHPQHQDDALNQKLNTIIEKYPGFKIVKIGKPKDVIQHQSGAWSCSIGITLSTTICAALHGASRGKVDKMSLGKSIIQRLDRNRNDQWFELHDTSTNGHSSSNCQVDSDQCQRIKLDSTAYHEKSGHINIFLQLEMVIKEENEFQPNNINDKKNSIDNNVDMQIDDKKQRMEVVISNFIKSNNKENAGSNKIGLQPPYKLTVKSIPSSLSGRDPKVHRLYTKYQAAIHNDPDPFARTHVEDSNMAEISDDVEFSAEFQCTASVDGVWSKLSEEDFEKLYQREYDVAQRKRIYKRYEFTGNYILFL